MAKTARISLDGEAQDSGRLPWKPFPIDYLGTNYVPAGIFRTQKIIGKGASAFVQAMKPRHKHQPPGDRLFAVKSFNRLGGRDTTRKYLERVLWEYTMAVTFEHPNIIRTIALCRKSDRLHQVMEHCPRGDLYKIVSEQTATFSDKCSFFKQLLCGVEYLHDRGVAHRDIKPENILLGQDGRIKIVDFGVAEIVRGQHPGLALGVEEDDDKNNDREDDQQAVLYSLPSRAGSRPYQSPEVVALDAAYDATKLDVWGCGVTLLLLMQGRHPWRQACTAQDRHYERFEDAWLEYLGELEKKNGGHARPEDCLVGDSYPRCGPIFSTLLSRGMERCVLKMLHPVPEIRLSIKEALENAWVQSIPDGAG